MRLESLLQQSYTPLAYRYLTLTAHYRSHLNFTWQGLSGAQTALNRMRRRLADLPEGGRVDAAFRERFIVLVNRDLNMPQALALAWQVFDSDISPEDKRATLLYFDRVFGLQLERNEEIIIPVQVQALADQRLALKQQGRYQEADKLRDEIVELGYQVNDVGNHTTTLQRR